MREVSLVASTMFFLESASAQTTVSSPSATSSSITTSATSTTSTSTENISGRNRFAHSLGLWTNTQWTDQASAARTQPFSLYLGEWSRERASQRQMQKQSGNWTFGVGEEGRRFVQASTANEWSQAISLHQVALKLDGTAGLYRDTVAFESLETQYLIEDPENPDIEIAPAKREESSIVLALTDTIRISGQWTMNLEGELRVSRSLLDQRRDDVTSLQTSRVGTQKSWSRLTWNLQTEESRLKLTNLLSENQGEEPTPELEQRLQSWQTQLEYLVFSRLYLGLGYQVYRSRFVGAPVQGIDGPTVSLRQELNGQWGWNAQLASLKNRTGSEADDQTFGSFTLNYRPSRQSSWEWTTTRELNLLSSYRSLSVDPFLPDAGQQYALDSSLSWNWQRGKWDWTLTVGRSLQKYPRQEVDADTLRAEVSYATSRTSQLTQELSLAQTRNREDDLTIALRKAGQWRTAYLYSWGGGALAMGRRSFVGSECNVEVLNDPLQNQGLRRVSLLVSVGVQ